MVKMQIFRKGFGVPVVLFNRVLEIVLLAEDNLGPLVVIFPAEYPSLDVFCLDDEDAVDRHQNMIYLCRTILRGDNNVIDPAIRFFVQECPHAECGDLFSKPAFYCINHAVTSISHSRFDRRLHPRVVLPFL